MCLCCLNALLCSDIVAHVQQMTSLPAFHSLLSLFRLSSLIIGVHPLNIICSAPCSTTAIVASAGMSVGNSVSVKIKNQQPKVFSCGILLLSVQPLMFDTHVTLFSSFIT